MSDEATETTEPIVDYDGTSDTLEPEVSTAVDTSGETEPEAGPDDEPDEVEDSPNREAAKYRRRLRESEARMEELAGQIEALQRQTVEKLATSAGRLHTAEPLWAGGAQLGDLLADDGTVDHDKVIAACDEVANRLSITRRPGANYVRGEGGLPRALGSSGTDGMIDVVQGR